MFKKIAITAVALFMSVASFAEEQGPLCPQQGFVKGANMSQAQYIEQVEGYIAASEPMFDEENIWFVIDGPFQVDSESAAIREGQSFLTNARKPFSQHAQTRPDVDAWFCIYYVGQGNKAILAATPKFGATVNPMQLMSVAK